MAKQNKLQGWIIYRRRTARSRNRSTKIRTMKHKHKHREAARYVHGRANIYIFPLLHIKGTCTTYEIRCNALAFELLAKGSQQPIHDEYSELYTCKMIDRLPYSW